MRILINDHSGHAFPYDLSGEFAARGHEVHHVYCSEVVTPKSDFSNPDVVVYPIASDRTFAKYDVRRRILDELTYGWRSVRIARKVRPDRVIASNTPVLTWMVIWIWGVVSRTKCVLWLQDIQAGLAELVLGRRTVATRALAVLERWLIRRAWRVVGISDEFRSKILEFGARPDRVSVIENWAPLDELPVRPHRNSWSERNGLVDSFVFLYSGTLAMKHNPRLLLALADEFANDPSVRVVVVSEGVGANWLRDENIRQPRANLNVLPFQPFPELADVLGSADVLVTVLESAAGMFSVPSKTLSYLCAGRPILGSIPHENAAARLIAVRAEAGLNVTPGDAGALVTAARKLFGDPKLRETFGENARRYAERTFERRGIGDRFTRLLSGV